MIRVMRLKKLLKLMEFLPKMTISWDISTIPLGKLLRKKVNTILFFIYQYTCVFIIEKKVQKYSTQKRWLEIALGIDYSVISFHGIDKVTHYVLTLMNIVS